MPDAEIIQATPENLSSFSLCGYKNPKRPGYAEKANWLLSRMAEGLKLLVVRASDGSTQGMIEYVPGPNCWRPILADDYLVIHCLAVGFRKAYRNKGLGGELIRRCEEDARVLGFAGVAVVTRKGSFMAGDAIFLKRGYREADRAAPDFSLMVKPFGRTAPKASFAPNVASPPEPFYNGLIIVRADQCPYSVTNVKEIVRTAKADFHVSPKIVELSSAMEAQHSPAPFGTFGIFYRGRGIAHHTISAARFRSIMSKVAPLKARQPPAPGRPLKRS